MDQFHGLSFVIKSILAAITSDTTSGDMTSRGRLAFGTLAFSMHLQPNQCCPQVPVQNWQSAYRDEDPACGAAIPSR